MTSQFNSQIKLTDRTIGSGQPVFIVAEIGINHNGDLALAKEEIDAAAEAGADSVKLQNFYTEDFITDHTPTITYQTYNGGDELMAVTESQFSLFKRNEISRDWIAELAEYSRAKKICLHSTPTSKRGISDLVNVGIELLKNGSDFLTNLEFVRSLGKTGLPTVLSTGMSTISEIDDAVRVFSGTGNKNLILLHCTSSYPTPSDEINIRRIKTIADTWGVLTGFSDHSVGSSAAVLSIAMESCWLEKHFTIDKKLPGPDHRFSLDPTELSQLVREVRSAEKQLGSPSLGPTSSEIQSRNDYRLSCVSKDAMKAGDIIQDRNVAFHRPGNGLKPVEKNALIGRQLKKSIKQGHVFDIENDF